MNLDQQVQDLMLQNQPLKAWELVKDTDYPLKKEVYAKIRHAFDPKEYEKFYKKDMEEIPFPKKWTFGCDRIVPRYSWLMGNLVKLEIESLLDIGCGSGELGLTLGILEISSIGLNLNEASVLYANKLAEEKRIDNITHFLTMDFSEYTDQHDVVVMFDLIEHMPDPIKALKKVYSLVKPGGHLYISTPQAGAHYGIKMNKWVAKPQSWADGQPSGHLRLWSEQEFKDLLKLYNVIQFVTDITGNMIVEVKKNE